MSGNLSKREKLAEEPGFVKGSKWEEIIDGKMDTIKESQLHVKKNIPEKPHKRKDLRQEVEI